MPDSENIERKDNSIKNVRYDPSRSMKDISRYKVNLNVYLLLVENVCQDTLRS